MYICIYILYIYIYTYIYVLGPDLVPVPEQAAPHVDALLRRPERGLHYTILYYTILYYNKT